MQADEATVTLIAIASTRNHQSSLAQSPLKSVMSQLSHYFLKYVHRIPSRYDEVLHCPVMTSRNRIAALTREECLTSGLKPSSANLNYKKYRLYTRINAEKSSSDLRKVGKHPSRGPYRKSGASLRFLNKLGVGLVGIYTYRDVCPSWYTFCGRVLLQLRNSTCK
jgi:hypothetical protein